MPDFHVYEPLDAPDVEVEIDGQCWPGEARMPTSAPAASCSPN